MSSSKRVRHDHQRRAAANHRARVSVPEFMQRYVFDPGRGKRRRTSMTLGEIRQSQGLRINAAMGDANVGQAAEWQRFYGNTL